MRLSSFALVVAFAACSYAAPHPASHVVHEKRHFTPSQWTKRDRIPSEAILPMRIGLTQNNLENGHDFLMDVYVLEMLAIMTICDMTNDYSKL